MAIDICSGLIYVHIVIYDRKGNEITSAKSRLNLSTRIGGSFEHGTRLTGIT